MTVGEFKEVLSELKEKGYTDQMIIIIIYSMYANNELTTKELEDLYYVMGYEFSDEFKYLSEEEKHQLNIHNFIKRG